MNDTLKKTIATGILFLAILAAYQGSYQPYRKATAYIDSLESQREVRTWDDFASIFTPPFLIKSPYGQEEIVKNFGSSAVQQLIEVNTQGKPEVARVILKYFDQFLGPIYDRGSGLSYGQTVQVMGSLRLAAYHTTGEKEFADQAEKIFQRGLTDVSVGRPQYMYSLLDLYKTAGRKEDAKKMAEEILSHWNDPKVKAYLAKSQ